MLFEPPIGSLVLRGRRQAFWIGFFATMLIIALGFPKDFVPKLLSTTYGAGIMVVLQEMQYHIFFSRAT